METRTENRKKMDELFKIAVQNKASDLHLVVNRPPILRIDGSLVEIKNQEKISDKKMFSMLDSILNEVQKEKLFKNKDLDMSYEIEGVARFRVNMHWEKERLGMVARVIGKKIPTMEEIEMPKCTYDMVRMNNGLILVTGPTGCGKSTTLAALIDLIIKERSCHIITIEDPIEFIFESTNSIIKQRELGSDVLSFAAGLKHTLRQDPNVIMVGEMRDLETIAATMTLAETGHLVLATLHTINAAQTVDRVIDVFPPYQQDQIRVQLSMSLRGVISQRLIAKKGGGRMATREILINNPAISNLIRENKIAQIKTVIQTSADVGMITMDQDIKKLYQNDMISKEVAISNMIDPKALR